MCPQTGNPRITYTIITTQASPFMETIHNSKKRMPVILAPEHETRWLDQAPIAEFGFPYAVKLEARSI
jgi:putative SOS response-associated peptidase YedK